MNQLHLFLLTEIFNHWKWKHYFRIAYVEYNLN